MTAHQRRQVAPAACLGALLLLASVLSGCMAMVQVQPMATGRSDAAAYMLSGEDLNALRREAQALCPLGGDILRQSAQHQRPELTGGRWRTAVNAAALWLDPPPQSAQMVVVCREPGDRFRLQAAAPAPQAASAAATVTTETTAALPVGPILPEW